MDALDEFDDLINLMLPDLVDDDFDDDVERFEETKQDEIAYLTSKQYSENTSRKIVSVIRLFQDWVKFKNQKLRLSLQKVPTYSLDEWSVDDLNR